MRYLIKESILKRISLLMLRYEESVYLSIKVVLITLH